MTTPTVAVTVHLADAEGNPHAGVRVEAKLDRLERYEGAPVTEDSASGTTDDNGDVVLALFPNNPVTGLGTTGSSWRFVARPPGFPAIVYMAQVPNQDCALADILDAPEAPVPSVSDAQAAEENAQAHAAAAALSASLAAASAAAAAADAAAVAEDTALVESALAAIQAGPLVSFNGRSGIVELTEDDVNTALGGRRLLWLTGSSGDGTTNDTAAVHALLEALADSGGIGIVGPGIHLCDPYLRDYATDAGQPFTLYFLGQLRMRAAGNALEWRNAEGVHLIRPRVDSRFSVLGDAGHGVVFYNCNDCSADDGEALDFKGTGFIGYTDSQTTGTVYERVWFRRCLGDAAAAKAAGHDTNGVLLADYWRGGLIDCAGENVTSFGVELKQNARYNIVTNPRGKNCGIAFGMGQTTVGSDGCDYNVVSNVVSENCLEAVAIGEGTHNMVDGVLVDMTGVAQADQVDAVRFDTDAAYNTVRGIKTKGMRKPTTRFITGADHNFAEVVHEIDTGGAHMAAAFDAGADNNSVEVGHVEGFDASLSTRVSNAGTGNRVFYRRSGWRFGLDKYRWEVGTSGGAAVSSATHIKDSGSGAVIEQIVNAASSTYQRNIGMGATTGYASETISGASAYWQWTINGVSYRLSSGGYIPQTDNNRNLGSVSLRWGSGYITNLRPGAGTVIWTSGAGTPEGAVAAPIGSLYTRTDGAAGTTLYVKEAGISTSGWTAINPGRLNDFRLSLTPSAPVPTGDVVGASILYAVPYKGDAIALYVASTWQLFRAAAGFSLNLTGLLTVGRPHDVFYYSNAGTPAIEVLAWSSDTVRATLLTSQDGVLVKAGDPTRRYAGTIYPTGSGSTEDSEANRYVWNYANRVRRTLRKSSPTSSWIYSTAAWRVAANSLADHSVNFVLGVAEDAVNAAVQTTAFTSAATDREVRLGVGLDSTSVPADWVYGRANNGVVDCMTVTYDGFPSSSGKHYLAWLEYGAGADAQTWRGSAMNAAIHGSLFA